MARAYRWATRDRAIPRTALPRQTARAAASLRPAPTAASEDRPDRDGRTAHRRGGLPNRREYATPTEPVARRGSLGLSPKSKAQSPKSKVQSPTAPASVAVRAQAWRLLFL